MSVKPEPVLRNFFRMFVDETTLMLDPTCGSGSSLRAAESLNARYTLGLEIDADFAKQANAALRNARILRRPK
jgi:DNA modification methylase